MERKGLRRRRSSEGAIGVSGDTSEHDNQCAAAGVAALN